MTAQNLDGAAIFTGSLRLIRQNALVLTGVPFLINLFVTAVLTVVEVIFGSSTFVLELLIPPIISGVVTLLAADIILGGPPDLTRAWQKITAVLIPLTILSTLATILSALGMIALIVPGFYIAAVMLPLVSVVVLEDASWSALGRTYDMAQPHAWPLVGLMLRILGLAMVALFPALFIVAMVSASDNGPSILLNAMMLYVASTIGAMISVNGLLVHQVLRGGGDVSGVFR